jgi:hypothetical protein
LVPEDLSVELGARVGDDLEQFVTPERFPSARLTAEAEISVAARVEAIVRRYRARHERMDVVKERERQQALRDAEVGRLIDAGEQHALATTRAWDPLDQARARGDVMDRLREEVRPDWTLTEVRALVDEVLGEWQEREGEDDGETGDGEEAEEGEDNDCDEDEEEYSEDEDDDED